MLSFDNNLVRPSSVLERRIKSSAHDIQVSSLESPGIDDRCSADFIVEGKSGKIILQKLV